MSFQYTYDSKGNTIGVFVPINEWNKITNVLKEKKSSKQPGKKNNILANIETGLKQAGKAEKGLLKPMSLKKLLDEL